MTHGRYIVGGRAYRGHEPGTIFVAKLDGQVEQRAILRGSIRLLGRVTPTLPANHQLPKGWT